MNLPVTLSAGLLLLFCSPINPALPNKWVVWNVGQGLWVTHIRPTSCLHFDMGGETFPNKVTRYCFDKRNYAFFSHWDWDHIGFISQARRKLKRLCVVKLPNGKTQKKKTLLFSKVGRCQIHGSLKEMIHEWTPTTVNRNSNANSRVFFDSSVLLPGDSPQKQEKIWLRFLSPSIETVVLGHHGSKTSTSKELLKHLKNLKTAISSARKRRYGHPHNSVENKLRRRGISLLLTEDWGNVFWAHFGE